MIQNDDGSVICIREELLNGSIKVLTSPYPLSEHQFHVLIQNGDSYIDNLAGKVFYVAIGVLLQMVAAFLLAYYYNLTNNKGMVDTTMSQLNVFQICLLAVCLVISGVLKIIGTCMKSERKELIKDIKASFKK